MSERPILIRGGRVIDPSRGADGPADVLLAEGRVEAVGTGLGVPDGARVVEAAPPPKPTSTPAAPVRMRWSAAVYVAAPPTITGTSRS